VIKAFQILITLIMAMLSFLLLGAIARAKQARTGAADEIRGTWVITSIYNTQNVQGPSPDEQKELIGSEIVYSDRSVKSCNQSVAITSVDQNRDDASDFLANTLVRFSEVQIHGSQVTEVVLNNREAGTCFGAFPLPGQDVYLKGKDEILIDFEGVFYRALRKK
jgi:hypothetical protein